MLISTFILVNTLDFNSLIRNSKPHESSLNPLLRFIKFITPLENKFPNSNEDKNVEKQEWLMDHLTSRKDLARIMKTVYKIIVFKKIAKFFLILGLLFFIPVLNKNNISENTIDLDNERDFDIFSFISKILIFIFCLKLI